MPLAVQKSIISIFIKVTCIFFREVSSMAGAAEDDSNTKDESCGYSTTLAESGLNMDMQMKLLLYDT